MQGNEAVQSPIIEGYFSRAQAKRVRHYSLPLLLLLTILLSGALVWQSPAALAAAIAVGAPVDTVIVAQEYRQAGKSAPCRIGTHC